MNYDNIEGVWIPREIWFNIELTLPEKVLFTQIKSLDRNADGCTASNSYFSKFMDLSESRISEIITSLCNKKFIMSKIIRHQTTSGIKTQRHLKSCVKLGIVNDPFKIDNDVKLSLISSSENRTTPSEKRSSGSENRTTPSENAQYINILNSKDINKDNSKDHSDLIFKAYSDKYGNKPHFESKHWKQFKKWVSVASLDDTKKLCLVFNMDTAKEFNAKRIIESFPSPFLWVDLINWIRRIGDNKSPIKQEKPFSATWDRK